MSSPFGVGFFLFLSDLFKRKKVFFLHLWETLLFMQKPYILAANCLYDYLFIFAMYRKTSDKLVLAIRLGQDGGCAVNFLVIVCLWERGKASMNCKHSQGPSWLQH